MGTAISCKECSQMAGLIQKVGRDSSKAPSLRAAVFRLKIVRAAIVTRVLCHLKLHLGV